MPVPLDIEIITTTDDQLSDLPFSDIEPYGDGFPQDESSQGVDHIELHDISRPFDPGFQNSGHIPLTITHSGESV